MWHQQWQCHQFKLAGDSFLKVEVTKSPSKLYYFSKHQQARKIASCLRLNSISTAVHHHKWLDIGSNRFKNESLILCNEDGPMRRAFGRLEIILSLGYNIVFICSLFKTIKFDNNFQAFQIEESLLIQL